MSRIGRTPVAIPAGVDVTIKGREVTVRGPRGVLSMEVASPIEVSQADGRITVTCSPYLTVSSSTMREARASSPHTTR